jgi:hypothetical protein
MVETVEGESYGDMQEKRTGKGRENGEDAEEEGRGGNVRVARETVRVRFVEL